MTTFDPATFMNQTVDEPISADYVLCPEGEYQAMIDDFDENVFRTNEFVYSKGPSAGLPGEMTTFNCPWVIQDDRAKLALNRDKVIVPMPVILDFDQNGALDHGTNKNVKLGQLREATGQNGKGPWTIANLKNAGPAMVRVVHREITRKDKTKYKMAEIDRVVPIR
jgi:hypothetical protein